MRDFGAIGYPPERFSKAAMRGFIAPCTEHLDALRAVWKTLTEEERGILDARTFQEAETEQEIRDFCLRIHRAYMVQRGRELTRAFVHLPRRTLLRAG